jgi:hypothetical protein
LATASIRLIGRRATLHVTAADHALEVGQSCAPLGAHLLRDVDRGHVIVPFWSAHQLTIALLALERFGLRPALSRFEIVADDSFAGEVVFRMGEKLGLTMRRIHTRGNAKRLEDVSAWMRNPTPFFIAVDGGSTYGTVPTGIVRMAARLRSTIWPVAIRAKPHVHVPGLVADFPVPRASRVALAIANPFRFDRVKPVAEAALDLKTALDVATAAADAAVAGLPPPDRDRVWLRMERAS